MCWWGSCLQDGWSDEMELFLLLDDEELDLVLVELEDKGDRGKDDCEEDGCAAHGNVAEAVND